MKIFLNIQWIFFILFYGWCNSNGIRNGIINSNRDNPQEIILNYQIGKIPRHASLSLEINDTMAIRERWFTNKNMADNDRVREEKSTSGWLKRKLLSIEGDSFAVGRDDTGSDYRTFEERKADYAGKFAGGRGPYNNEGVDYRDKHGGDPAGDDYYLQSDDSNADISELGNSFGETPSNRYATDVGDTATYWNKANHRRESVQEMDGYDDSRNSDKVIGFHRRRKSAKSVEGEMPPSDSTSNRQEPTQEERTVYRQQYDDSEQIKTSTPCDCVAKCATSESIPNEETEEPNITESEEVVEEDTTAEAEEETENTEEPVYDTEETTTQDSVEDEAGQENALINQKEVYIDLRIGIKSAGNQSLSAQGEPVEIHKKMVVKREEFGNDMSFKTSPLATESKFPVDLIEAIYQLVDKDDSLRKHVAPRLPDRTKLLSKLEQPGRRQNINDGPLESTSNRYSKAVTKIEDDPSDNNALASVLEAIGDLIRKRT